MSAQPLISVVIATYNRPDTLSVAIDSVRQQDYANWELIVVGDHCDDATEDVVNAADDVRIRYVNLPRRFGEQSGPSSIGIALANGDYVAFLNHDDLFLQDHLSKAVSTIEQQRAELFVGRTVFAKHSFEDAQGTVVPVFSEINPPNRKASDTFHCNNVLFEPSSSWVIATETARRLGNWKTAATIHRTPMREWILRAWGKGVKFAFADLVTVLKVATQYQKQSADGCYSEISAEHDYLSDLLAKRNADEIRHEVLKTVEEDGQAHYSLRHKRESVTRKNLLLIGCLTSGLMGQLYRFTGIDGYEICGDLLGLKRGHVLNSFAKKRTGKSLPDAPKIEAVLAELANENLIEN